MVDIAGTYTKSDGAQVIVGILPFGLDPTNANTIKQMKCYCALIDTGASRTFISHKAIEQMNLHPFTKEKVRSPYGTKEENCYQFQLAILCEVPKRNSSDPATAVQEFHSIVGSSQPLEESNFDILIGRDLLSKSHFSMDSSGTFTISLPSQNQ